MILSEYIIIGKFVPKDSFIHRLDPRTKLVFVFIFILLIFTMDNLKGYGILLFIELIAIFISKIPFRYIGKGLIPILWFVVITAIVQLIGIKNGPVILDLGFFKIHSQGVQFALYYALRIIVLISIATILTLTTSSIDITIGLEKLMYPLKIIKVPVHEIALMMSISLRFIPTLIDEADMVIKAQKSKGANIDSGPVYKRMKDIMSIIIPLIINAMKRADALAIAMESRGYRGGEGRTRLKEISFSWRDRLLVASFVVVLLIILIFKRFII